VKKILQEWRDEASIRLEIAELSRGGAKVKGIVSIGIEN